MSRLVQESERVIQARARSERDVRGFLKSGLADEQLRVGALLQEIFQAALHVDWQSQKVRRAGSPLPPIGISAANLPLIERVLIKQVDQGSADDLELTVNAADPQTLDDEFWSAYRALNRARLFEATIAHLRASGKPLTIGELAKALPPSHDLETLACWLAMARQAGIPIPEGVETIDLQDNSRDWTRFYVPHLELSSRSIDGLTPELLE